MAMAHARRTGWRVVLHSFWADHELHWSDGGGLSVIRRPQLMNILSPIAPLDFVFYAWEPDLTKRWPAVFAPAARASVISTSKPKPKHKTNRESDYPREAIRAVAEEALAKNGPDKHRSWFYDRVRELCRQRQPRIKAPANDRTMGRIISDLYHRPKR